MTAHTKVSLAKSVLRILGYIAIYFTAPCLAVGCALLFAAEVLGILEELPSMYKGTKVS